MRTLTRAMSCFTAGIACTAVLAVVSLAPGTARAEERLDGAAPTYNTRALGLAGALRASPAGTSGVYLNPATIAMIPLYHVEAMYQYTGEDNQHMGGLAIVDAVTTVVAAGLAFNYSRIDDKHLDHEAYDVRLSLAGGFGDVFYIGLTGRYLHLAQNTNRRGWGPAGRPALPPSGSQNVDGFTFDAGAGLRLGGIVTIGVVGQNLTNTDSVFAPLELGPGASIFLLEMLLIEADVVIDFTTHSETNAEIRGAAELFIANIVPLRAGYIHDVYLGVNTITAGVGYVDRQFGFDVGFSKDIYDGGPWMLGASFKYFVN